MGTGDAVGISETKETTLLQSPKYWFIARVRPNTEKSTRNKLQALGYETFVATQQELRFWKNGARRKKKMVEKVVITQYLFLHVSRKDREDLIRYSFIKEFMRDKATKEKTDFALMSDKEMETLMRMFGQSEHPVIFDTANFTIGEEVLLHIGSFDYTAHVVRRHGDNATYYGVRIGELGCAYMDVPSSALRKQ